MQKTERWFWHDAALGHSTESEHDGRAWVRPTVLGVLARGLRFFAFHLPDKAVIPGVRANQESAET
jgi:hypothetical protein